MKQFITGVVAAMAMGVMAEITNTVKVTKFHQSYPYSGKATVEYTVGGTLPANAFAEIIINTDNASATFTQKNIVTGANTNVIDFASSFGGALLLTNASFVVAITEGPGGVQELGGVQLWENGPYWAECNVGATKPEEYGYYFWWGDTVGYTNTGSGWISVKGGRNISFYSSDGTAASTYGKDYAALMSAGYIDSIGNLVAAHDAATAHLGSPWRMPTNAEFSALISNCTTTWITYNGVSGRLMSGKGSYANRSIFLPAAGSGTGSGLYGLGSFGEFWSSTPASSSNFAWFLHFASVYFGPTSGTRHNGLSVRPVRGFAGAVAFGIVTYDLPPVTETQTTSVPVPYAWLRTYYPTVVDEYEAYEVAARATAANGRLSVAECYVLGLDPTNPLDDFMIASFPMTADGMPDLANIEYYPPKELWNVPDAPVVLKGAATLEGPWMTVKEEVGRGVPPSRGGSPGTACSTRWFFKAVVFGNADDETDDADDGVQLWEGGPYWATKNVGAEEPWEYGYYFWWGDTVGYTRSGGTWTDYGNGDGRGYYDGVTWVSSTGQQMNNSPFDDSSCPTIEKDYAVLMLAGYIDSTGNLVAEHDAATAHLGAPWRMPTSDEIDALIANSTTTWITTNGVSGRLMTGKGSYANRSIFLPAAGKGDGSGLYDPGSIGEFWLSMPNSYDSYSAWGIYFGSSYFNGGVSFRYCGRSVRPVRGSAP